MKQNLYSEKLLLSLDKFIQQMQQLNKADNPELVLKLVMKWTQAQPLLTKKLLQYILQSEPRIREGEEAIAVEKTIKKRLLQEFEPDELTRGIRKLLYKKDLETLLQDTNGQITNKEQAYLLDLQEELGLTSQQCQNINSENSIFYASQHIRYTSRLLDNQAAQFKNTQPNLSLTKVINKSSSSSPSIRQNNYQQPTLVVPGNKQPTIKPTINKSFQKKWLWLLLGIPFFLSIKAFDLSSNPKPTIVTNSSVLQQKLCVDLSTRQSPRMSLGEKLLTQEYHHLKPLSTISLYEGGAAFARCEFSAAKNKFQQSLTMEKNNPEALIYFNNAQAITQEHIKIAVGVPLGSQPGVAWEILRGVAQAQTEINQQGGIKQKLLLIQVVNDDNNPEVTRYLAKQLTKDETILAVVGHNDSNTSLAAAEIYQQQGLVMISPTSGSTKLSGIGNYIMRTIPSVAVMANTLADYALSHSLTKIAVCSDPNSSASTSFTQEFIASMTEGGGEISAVECNFSQGNFQPQILIEQIISQNANALLLVPSVTQRSQAIAIAQANQQRLPLLGNHSLYTFETIQQGKDAVAGMIVPSPWLPNTTPNNNFSATSMKYWGGKVNWRTAMAYDATASIIQGLQHSSTHTRSELHSILTQSNLVIHGASGRFRFDHGDRHGKVQLASIQQSINNPGELKFSYIQLKD